MKFKSLLFLILFITLFDIAVRAQSPDVQLTQLRSDFANRYLQPDSHFALAKYYLEHGQPVQAFYILEYARHYRFEEPDFDKAFIKFFGDPMPEPPDDAKVDFKIASDLVAQQKLDEAEALFRTAYSGYDRSFFINAWIGRFYYKAKTDPARALPFYFKSYFLYPHAYETEFVESRIRKITVEDAQTDFRSLRKDGKPLSELVRNPNPLIVSMALEEMASKWAPEYLSPVVYATTNDESSVRWQAFMMIQKLAGSERDKIVNEMLAGADLRKRGLAAYAVIERPGPEKFETLKKMLTEPSELLRFDAASALAMKGGETGKQILRQHQPTEKQLRLKELIVRVLKGEA